MRIVFDLDGTVIGIWRRGADMAIGLRPGAVEYIQRLKRAGHTPILWTFGSREWWRRVRGVFPVLRQLFDEVYTRDERPGKVTAGAYGVQNIKDIREIRGDYLIDNEPAHYDWAVRHGRASRYCLVPTYGGSEGSPRLW